MPHSIPPTAASLRATASRAELVDVIRRRFIAEGFPRVQVAFILSGAGLAGFLCSVLLLRLGLASMGLRYALSSLGGYVAFLGLVRLWIGWHRNRWDAAPDLDPLDLTGEAVSAAFDTVPRPPGPSFFAGGRSGGGGVTGSWGSRSSSASSRTGGGGFSLDFDEAWPLIVAGLCAVGGLIAIGFVIYSAPILLAEVALDAALVTTAYRRLRRDDVGTWLGATARRTWVPATLFVLFLGGAGFALQRAVPEARSIGGVVRALTTPER